MNKLNQTIDLEKDLQTRRYDLDWLRVLAIVILLYYHVGMMYVAWDWHIKYQPAGSAVLEFVMRFLHQWRMPLLFLISGAGTYYALGKRSAGEYAGERVKRLFLPLLFGMLVIVPPQIYLEKVFQKGLAIDYWAYYPQVFNFVPYPKGDFSWHHLWFVAYLFIFSLLVLPLFIWWRTQSANWTKNRLLWLIKQPGGVLWLVLPIIVSQIILRPFYPEETHDLLNDWAYFVFNLFPFIYGYILSADNQYIRLISNQRRILLGASILATLVMYMLVYGNFFDDSKAEVTWLEVAYIIDKILVMWFSVVATLGYAYRYLNFDHPWRKQLNEGVYPFYILHQTVIIMIGFQVLRWNLGLWTGFWVLSTLSFISCVGLYWFLIRPFRLMRFLFGLK
jgi:glucans biosynthesis protein C